MNAHGSQINDDIRCIEISDSKFEFVDSLRDTNYMVDLFFDNKFQEAYSRAEQYSSVSMMHAHAKAILSYLIAMMTFEKDEMLKARKDVEESLRFANKHRKSKSIVESVTYLLWRTNTCKYTDEELHAELIYGECHAILATLTFFSEQSIKSLIQSTIRITTAYHSFKFCNESLSGNKQWNSEEVKMQFESGVLNGSAGFNLALSMVPQKIMRMLKIVGFSGSKEVGLECLRMGTELTFGIRCRASVLALAGFAMYVEPILCINEIDTEWVKSLLDYWIHKFPKSVCLLIYLARYRLMSGEPKKSIDEYNNCIAIQNEWKFIHKVCHWDLLWCYMILFDWDNAINEAKVLSESSIYSPATIEYQIAVCKMMQVEDSKNENLRHKIDARMRSVPILKRRFGGKTFPQEKFLCTRALQYFDENRRDGFIALMTNELAGPFLKRIDEKLKLFETMKVKHERIAFLTLVKGVIFRSLDKDEEAVTYLHDVIDSGKRITNDTFIVPHAVLELGITYLKMKKLQESRLYLEKAQYDDFDKYLNESIVTFRVASALRQLDYMENSTTRSHKFYHKSHRL